MSGPSIGVISTQIRRALAQRGPMLEEELLGVLLADGIDLGPYPADAVGEALDVNGELFLPLADGRKAWLPALLDGRVFTHRLTAVEAKHDLIECGPDIAPLTMLTESPSYELLTDGSPVTDVSPLYDDALLAERGIPRSAIGIEGALLFEDGRFSASGLSAGDLVGLRVTDDGFDLTAVTFPVTNDIAPSVAAAVAPIFAARPDAPEMLDIAVWTACADKDELFRQPVAPLSELLAAAGLIQEGDWLAPQGFDFGAWRVQQRVTAIQRRYDVDDDEALAVLAVVRLFEQTAELVDAVADAQEDGDTEGLAEIMAQLPQSPPTQPATAAEATTRIGPDEIVAEEADLDRRTVRASLEFLAEPLVAAAVLAETDTGHGRAGMTLGLFAESVEPMAPSGARAALRWLRAMAYERLGDIEQAEKTLSEAESLDPSWPLTLLSLARYASDRGDAPRGLSLLKRAGAPRDHELVQVLEAFQPAPRPGIGRNHPCWCGSGRKYKVCHLNGEQLPLEDRAAWLYQKAAGDLLVGESRLLLADLAGERARHWDDPDGFVRALGDRLVGDVALFEGGVFEEFLAVRGSLLPEDERSLGEQWLLAERSVYEVVDVRPGVQIMARDIRTGDVHQVRERTASRQVKAGEFYCMRVVPAGDTMQIFGGLEPVSLSEREQLMALLDDDADPVDLIAFLSRRFAPPRLQNTEGEPLVLCDATLRVSDPVSLVGALDGAYDRADDEADGAMSWIEQVTTGGMQRIRAELALTADTLQVNANSETRFDRVLAVIRLLDPSVTVLEEHREPAGDVTTLRQAAARTPGGSAPGAMLDPAHPAVAAVLEQMVRQHEIAWLDESIPALDGHTPRECAEDPTRRPDLIRLLESFNGDDGRPGAMSPARLRAELGLD